MCRRRSRVVTVVTVASGVDPAATRCYGRSQPGTSPRKYPKPRRAGALRILTGGWPLAMAAAGGNRFRDRRVPGR